MSPYLLSFFWPLSPQLFPPSFFSLSFSFTQLSPTFLPIDTPKLRLKYRFLPSFALFLASFSHRFAPVFVSLPSPKHRHSIPAIRLRRIPSPAPRHFHPPRYHVEADFGRFLTTSASLPDVCPLFFEAIRTSICTTTFPETDTPASVRHFHRLLHPTFFFLSPFSITIIFASLIHSLINIFISDLLSLFFSLPFLLKTSSSQLAKERLFFNDFWKAKTKRNSRRPIETRPNGETCPATYSLLIGPPQRSPNLDHAKRTTPSAHCVVFAFQRSKQVVAGHHFAAFSSRCLHFGDEDTNAPDICAQTLATPSYTNTAADSLGVAVRVASPIAQCFREAAALWPLPTAS